MERQDFFTQILAFAECCQFGDATHDIAKTALRLYRTMNPSQSTRTPRRHVLGAALLLAAKLHKTGCSEEQMELATRNSLSDIYKAVNKFIDWCASTETNGIRILNDYHTDDFGRTVLIQYQDGSGLKMVTPFPLVSITGRFEKQRELYEALEPFSLRSRKPRKPFNTGSTGTDKTYKLDLLGVKDDEIDKYILNQTASKRKKKMLDKFSILLSEQYAKD